MKLTGGCLCGGVRYEAAGEPGRAGWCHCRMCQRSSGAPAQTYVQVPWVGFEYVAGDIAVFQSSEHGSREFCPACGSQIAFRDTRDGTWVSLNIGTLDDPESAVPEEHIWTESEVSWFAAAPALPRFPRGA